MRAISQNENPETYYELQEDNSKKHQDRLFSAFSLASLLFCVFLVLYCRKIQGVNHTQPEVEGTSNLDQFKKLIQINLGEAAVGDAAPDASVSETATDVSVGFSASEVRSISEANLSMQTVCSKHQDCHKNEYCWDVNYHNEVYNRDLLGGPGYCDKIANCCKNLDSITKKCPSGSGCESCNAHSDCVVEGQFCSKDNKCSYCDECAFATNGIDGTCGICVQTLECDSHRDCRSVGRNQFCMDSGNQDYTCASCDDCDCTNGINKDKCGDYCPTENAVCEEMQKWDFGWFPNGSTRQKFTGIETMKECRAKCAEAGEIYKFCFHHTANRICMAAAARREVFEAKQWLLNKIFD